MFASKEDLDIFIKYFEKIIKLDGVSLQANEVGQNQHNRRTEDRVPTGARLTGLPVQVNRGAGTGVENSRYNTGM